MQFDQKNTDSFHDYIRYKNDPWAWITECVYTKDQVDRQEPIKRFPNKLYLKLFCRLWYKYPLLLCPKTRRMTMSWMTIALYTHEFVFNKAIHTAFVSKKEDDANDLVDRAKFILDNLDKKRFPRELLPKYEKTFNLLKTMDTDCKIQGFPMGADQLRQFTFSGIFGDESAFWDKAKEFYAATFPTIDGGGRMTLVSSPAPGFFKKLVFDCLDTIGDITTADYSPDYKVPMEGIRVWSNKKNKFMVFELHYKADPEKRDPEYAASIRSSMPLQEYLREYELHWDTFSGQPVYPEFQKLHVTLDEPTPQIGLPLIIGFDFGLTPACVIGQFQEDQLFIFKEFTEINMGAQRFLDNLVPKLKMLYPTHSDIKKDWICYIDPSGAFRKDTDEGTCAQIVRMAGFNVIPGPVAWEERRHSVVHFLQKLGKSGPAFQIFAKNCPMLVKGFEGGYHFADKAVDSEPGRLRPLKNLYSHCHDALQYLCSGVKQQQVTFRKNIPRPAYSTTMEKNHGR